MKTKIIAILSVVTIAAAQTSITYVNPGSSPDATDGDTIRNAFIKCNNDFTFIGGQLSTLNDSLAGLETTYDFNGMALLVGLNVTNYVRYAVGTNTVGFLGCLNTESNVLQSDITALTNNVDALWGIIGGDGSGLVMPTVATPAPFPWGPEDAPWGPPTALVDYGSQMCFDSYKVPGQGGPGYGWTTGIRSDGFGTLSAYQFQGNLVDAAGNGNWAITDVNQDTVNTPYGGVPPVDITGFVPVSQNNGSWLWTAPSSLTFLDMSFENGAIYSYANAGATYMVVGGSFQASYLSDSYSSTPAAGMVATSVGTDGTWQWQVPASGGSSLGNWSASGDTLQDPSDGSGAQIQYDSGYNQLMLNVGGSYVAVQPEYFCFNAWGAGTISGGQGNGILINGAGNPLLITDTGGNDLFVSSSGWVGIGNNSPNYTLDVTGSVGNSAAGNWSVDDTGSGIFSDVSVGQASTPGVGFALNRNAATGAIFNGSGYAAQFTVNPNYIAAPSFSMQCYDGSGNYINDAFTVNLATAQMGVNQINPAYTLDVNGSFGADSGNFFSDGSGNVTAVSVRANLLDMNGSDAYGYPGYVPTANGDGTWTWQTPTTGMVSGGGGGSGGTMNFDGGNITSDGGGDVTIGGTASFMGGQTVIDYGSGGVQLKINGGSGYQSGGAQIDVAGTVCMTAGGEVDVGNGGGFTDPSPGYGYDLKCGGTQGGITSIGRINANGGYLINNQTFVDGSGNVTAASVQSPQLRDSTSSSGAGSQVATAQGDGTWAWQTPPPPQTVFTNARGARFGLMVNATTNGFIFVPLP